MIVSQMLQNIFHFILKNCLSEAAFASFKVKKNAWIFEKMLIK